jgi:hypothetical protein
MLDMEARLPALMRTAMVSCIFRFYDGLCDFLPLERRDRDFAFPFFGTPSVKDTVEAVGVPHTEIDLILVNGESVDFAHLLHGGERVSVYPAFSQLDVRSLNRLLPEPLEQCRFVLDVHLGRLACRLRFALQ